MHHVGRVDLTFRGWVELTTIGRFALNLDILLSVAGCTSHAICIKIPRVLKLVRVKVEQLIRQKLGFEDGITDAIRGNTNAAGKNLTQPRVRP